MFLLKKKTFHIKELNEQAEEFGCTDITPNKLKTIINSLGYKQMDKAPGQAAKSSCNTLSLYERGSSKKA